MNRLLFVVSLVACSNGLNGETKEGDENARLLPSEIGVFIAEVSDSIDASALEVILPGTHRRVRVEGFGLDVDMQARRLIDPAGKQHIFTLHATQGVVVERGTDARALEGGTFAVYDPGKLPGSANPRDLAYASDGSLWVTRYGDTALVILRNGERAGTVDLKAFADADGRPDMSAIAIVGETAYVALRRLESGFGTTKNESTIVAINTKTLEPRAFVTLPAKNPGDKFKVRNNALYIACIGGPVSKPPDESAALVKIDLATARATSILDAKAAGGFVTAFELDDATGYAIVASYAADNPTSVVRFDPARGVLSDAQPWARTSGYSLWDLGLLPNSGLLLVADRSKAAPGLRILSTRDGARLGHIPTRLEPSEFFFLRSPDA